MSGSSYGGAIQLAVDAIDGRVDAIIPDVTWNALPASFFPDGAVSSGWKILICGGTGRTDGLPGNLLGPASAVLPRGDARLKSSCVEGLLGAVSPANMQWWAERTPPGLRPGSTRRR